MFLKTQPLVFLILLVYSPFGYSQSKVDSLQKKTYNEIYKLYANAENSQEKFFYGDVFLEKAKQEKNDEALIFGYRTLSNAHKDEKVLKYSDSIILITKDNSNENYPAIAYERKGDYYYKKRAYQRAFNNYLEFFRFAEKHNRKDQISRANYNIGTLKRRTGNLDEALEIFRENFSFIKENQVFFKKDNSYLNSISALASIFNDTQVVDSATYYNKYGIKESLRLKNEFYFNRFALNQGVTLFYKKEYDSAIDSLEKYIPYFEKASSQEDLPFAYYYTGQSYLAKNKEEIAIEYFKKVDAIFEKNQSLFPSIVETYTRLINYYKEKNDKENQLYYVEQLLKIERILHSDEVYLKGGIIKEYDIPKLKETQEKLLQEMKAKENTLRNTVLLLSSLLVLLIIGFVFQYRKRKIYRKRFHEIINNNAPIKKTLKEDQSDVNVSSKKISVPEDIIENVLKRLEIFEKENEFTSNEITLNYLAKKLNSNPNYLSKIINHYKEVSFSNYLNNLRIDYTVNQLKINLTYRKYTIKAISSEVGFNNVQSFTKAFYNSKGINPSYFIKELKKMD